MDTGPREYHLVPNDRVRVALDAAERVADGAIGRTAWAEAEAQVKAARGEVEPLTDPRRWDAITAAVIAISHASSSEDGVRLAANASAAASRAAGDDATAQARFIREVFRYPLRPTTFSSEWRTSTAVALAGAMYESREFSVMPILADALQDAGCDSADILDHCRDVNQVHVRGCWVIDLVLGKE